MFSVWFYSTSYFFWFFCLKSFDIWWYHPSYHKITFWNFECIFPKSMIFAGEKGFLTFAQDKMCGLSEKVTFMLMSDLSRWNLVLIISFVRNHGDIVLFNSSGSVSFQGISSTQINDLLILVSSANFHKNLIVQSSVQSTIRHVEFSIF